MYVPEEQIRDLGITHIKLIDEMKVSINYQGENEKSQLNSQFKKNYWGTIFRERRRKVVSKVEKKNNNKQKT